MSRHLCILAAAASLLAARAEAHAFESGADFYAQFLEGAGVILGYPQALLPLLALGVLLSLWDLEGMVRAWPSFLLGQLAGFLLAPVVGPWVLPATLAGGILAACLAALLPRHVSAEARGLAFLLGFLALAASLEGHGFLELSPFIYAGIVFAANLATAFAAGVARLAMEQVEAPWMRIAWRVAGSWLAAILTLFLAFSMVAT